MIPNRFHFVWIGPDFHFVYRLAVESLLQIHPEAEVHLHYENPPRGNPDWEALRSKTVFRPLNLDAWLQDLPASMQGLRDVLQRVSSAYPAGRSNVVRYLALYREGGVYLDFDTLTLKSFKPLLQAAAFVGEEQVFRCDDDRVAGRYTWDFPWAAALFGISYGLAYVNSRWLRGNRLVTALDAGLSRWWSARKLNNAVLGSEAGGAFYARALELIPNTDPGIRFALGPMLMNRTYAEMPEATRRLGENFFYAIPPSQTFRFFQGPAPVLPPEAIALHWCSSNHRQLAAKLTADAVRNSTSPSLYFRLARAVMARGI